jgi:hypothetical protein
MRKKWWIFVVAPPAFLLFIALGGWVVMLLWNWLLPPLFGWTTIGFWQALGLLALCRILFGGLGGRGGGGPRPGRRLSEKWSRMTPEERERFREGVRAGCEAHPPDPSSSGMPVSPA